MVKEIKFLLSLEDAEKMVWKDILEEDITNFTPEFQELVREVIKKIRMYEAI